MAGRGTDILLGGNPEALAKDEVGPPPEAPPPNPDGSPIDMTGFQKALADHRTRYEQALAKYTEQTKAEREEVLALGGLCICGTERHESRRVDNQLRGRAGRQGDPGVSKFFLSLEDDLMRIFGSERIASLMERLGMEEGEVIEHKWLSKAIENAQERVEGHNFDIRKNLLDYDDVMNQQRQTIYKLRRRVLAAGAGIPLVEYDEDKKTKAKIRSEAEISWADFREMVLDAVEDVIVGLTDTYCPNKNPDAWDLVSLQKAVKETFNVEMHFTANGTPEDIQVQIYDVVEKFYQARDEEFGQDFHLFLRTRYLATIDQLWKDHLLAMDHLRQGIGLRGYGQLDPKNEYKKEGYEGFLQMLSSIKAQFVNLMMRVPAKAQVEETQRLQRQMAQRQRNIVEGRGGAQGEVPEKAAAPKPAARQGPRVGRNDPCPCGSGKKYKKCHGAAEVEA
jgi:preprotein translocase subunit SecA